MNRTDFRVNAFNLSSILTLAIVFGAILIVVCVWNGGTMRFYAILAVIATLAFVVAQMYAARIRLDSTGLRVGGGVYQVAIPWDDVIGVVEGEAWTRLRWRTNGIGLPGFSLGWFRTSKDQRKVFVASGPTRNAIRIQLRGSRDVIVGTADRVALRRAMTAHKPGI